MLRVEDMKAALVVLVLAFSFIRVLSLPGGAPAEACSTLTPNHSPNSPQTVPNLYSIDLSAFDDGDGVNSYIPGSSYTLTLSAPGGSPTFRGFLIQARLVADDTTVVGSFSSPPSGARLSSCTPSNSAVTHSDNTDKSSISVIWTAPSTDMGTIYFAFAVVQRFDTFWADQRTAVVHDSTGVSISIDYTPPPDAVLGPNEYRAASRLTITCEVQGATGTVTYTWSPETTLAEVDGEPESRQRLFLRTEFNGIQTCTATDSGGTIGTASIPVNVVGIGVQVQNGDVDNDGVDDSTAALPNNGFVLSLPVAIDGNHFRILCSSESLQNNTGEIIGLDGTVVTTGSVFTVETVNPAAIVIRSTVDIGMNDQGVFTCRLPDISGTQLEANFGIYRNDFNTQPSVPTELTFDPIARTLTCTSTGSPATTVTWRKNGVELDIDGSTYQLTQTVTDRGQATYENVLTINLDLQSIAGTYTCLVSNTLGSVSRDIIVTGIEIEAPPQLLTVGGTATINCTTDLTVSSIQWLFSGEVVTEDTTGQQFLELTFDPVNDTTHERNYTCRVTATDGSIYESTTDVTVEVPTPAIEVSISAGGSSNAGETYTLTCTVTELIDGLTNTPTLQWMDSGGVISNDGRITVGSPMTVGSVTNLTLTFSPLQFSDGGEYTCQATLVSPAQVTAIEDSLMVTVTVQVLPPVITSVQPTSSTSIIVVWTQQGEADSFEIAYERVTGAMQQGLCPSVEDSDTVTVSDGTARQQTVMGLEEFSTYSFTITATVGAMTFQPSNSMMATTEQTAPSGAPQSVMVVNMTPTTVTVTWDPVNCIDRNSNITNYAVQYNILGSPEMTDTVPGTGDVGGSRTITGLVPETMYSIAVAAVNSGGDTGPFSSPTTVTTSPVPPPTVSISPTNGTATAGQSHSLTCSVTPGEGASGTPEVEWRGPGDSQLDGDSDIMVGSVSMVDSSTFTSTLDFTTLRTSHGGQYTCQATADSPMGTATTSVIVQIPTPMVIVSHDGPPNNTLPGGSSVTFACTITVDPAVDTDVTVMASWTSTGGRSGLSGSDPAVVLGAPVTTYQTSLTLDNLLTSDSGDYTCTASVIPSDPTFITSSAQQSDTVMITIELVVSISIDYTPPPDAVLGPNEYRAASRLTITCEVQGATGTVTYTWSPETTLAEVDGEPETRQRDFLRTEFNGIQTCTATDSGGTIGTASIPVNVVGIGVQVQNGDVDNDGVDDSTAALPNNGLVFSLPVTSGTRFRILCSSESLQNNTGEIIGLDGTPVTTDPFTVTISNHATIVIRSTVDIDMDDQGVYTCRLPDSSGTQTLEANFGIYRSDFNTQPSVPTELTFDPIARTLTCVSTGSPATTVTWRKNGVELDIDGSTHQLTQTVTDRGQATYENVLSINLDLQSIVGTYTCLVNNTLGSVSRDIIVTGIEIEAPPQPLTVGGTATINCTTDLMVSSIQWLFSGEVVAEDTTGQQLLELTFDPINDIIHERQYTCMVTLPGSLVFMDNITISVTVPLPALEVSITAPGGTPEAGQEYSLTCTVSEIVVGLTNMPTLQWLDSMGSEIPSGSGDITVGGEVTNATSATLSLMFSTLRTSHGGNYTCQARLESPAVEGGIMETEIQGVVVQIPQPTVTVTTMQPTYNGTVFDLTCAIVLDQSVDTGVSVTEMWSDSDSTLTTDRTRCINITDTVPVDTHTYQTVLIFDPLGNNSRDGDSYTCLATVVPDPESDYILNVTGMGDYELSVAALPLPEVTFVPPDEATEIGQSYTLTCTVTVVDNLFNEPDVMWLDPRGSLLSSGSGTTLNLQRMGSTSTLTFTFDSIAPSDAGEYTCRACVSIDKVAIQDHCASTTAEITFAVPGILQNLDTDSVSDSEVVVSWDEPEETNGAIVRYEVRVSRYEQGDNFQLEQVDLVDAAQDVTPPTTEATITNLERFTPYSVCVTAANLAGLGEQLCRDFFSQQGAPMAGPQNITALRLNGTAMRVRWMQLNLVEARGFVRSYIISYSPSSSARRKRQESTVEVDGSQDSTIINDLQPGVAYSVSVQARNVENGVVLSGPVSEPVTADFEEDTMLFQLQFRGVGDCSSWVASDTVTKAAEIVSKVAEETDRLCQCGFTTEHITEDRLRCFLSDSNEVTFRARLHRTEGATTEELISYIEQLVERSVTVVIQRLGLTLDSTCQPVAIDSFDDPECELATASPPTAGTTATAASSDNIGAIAGGVVGGILGVVLISSIIILIVILLLRSRGAKLDVQHTRTEKRELVELQEVTVSREKSITTTACVAYATTTSQEHQAITGDYEVPDICVVSNPSTTAGVESGESGDHVYDVIPGDAM